MKPSIFQEKRSIIELFRSAMILLFVLPVGIVVLFLPFTVGISCRFFANDSFEMLIGLSNVHKVMFWIPVLLLSFWVGVVGFVASFPSDERRKWSKVVLVFVGLVILGSVFVNLLRNKCFGF